uniref:Putative doublecortin-like kinase 1a n=2 Tax=Ixodes ricinus TaxID=34613 RepID=V5H5X4_IXORI
MGVIMYILLCGFPPFVSQSSNQDELFDQILSGRFEFMSPYWDDISASAKELIRGMLQVEVGERFTAAQVLGHPWLEHRQEEGSVRTSWRMDLHLEDRPRSAIEAKGAASVTS